MVKPKLSKVLRDEVRNFKIWSVQVCLQEKKNHQPDLLRMQQYLQLQTLILECTKARFASPGNNPLGDGKHQNNSYHSCINIRTKGHEQGINLSGSKWGGNASNKQLSYLRQQETYRGGCHRSSTDQRHHTIAVYSTVHLAVGWQHDPWCPKAGLANSTAAALKAAWQEQGAPPAVALLESTVLVVCKVVFGAHVSCTNSEAEQAGTAVPPR